MSFPIRITNPEDIPPGSAWTVSEEELKNITEQNEALINIRGRIISAALLVERKMDDILSIIFVGSEPNSMVLFKELLLNKEFFTFMAKWRVFKDMSNQKLISFVKEEDKKRTLTIIKMVINTRDRFAHGDIIFSGTKPQLLFSEDGKSRSIELNNQYFDELNKSFDQALYILDEIYKLFRRDINKDDQQDDDT